MRIQGLFLLPLFGAISWAQSESPASKETPFPASELAKVLEILCPGNGYVEGGKSGCKVCPDGTMSAGYSDGTVESTIAGHLLGPKSDDLLLVLRGCEPHATGFVDSATFTKEDGNWTIVSPMTAGAIGNCTKVPNREGREGLLCEKGDYHGGFFDWSLSFGYLEGGSFSGDSLLSTILVHSPCSPVYGMQTVIQSSVKKQEWARAASGAWGLNLVAECLRYRKDCKREKGPSLPMRTFSIQYVFDGERLKLAPSSATAKRAFDACSKFEEDPPPARPAAKKK